ncbi:hypothetical protein GTY65_39075 [Streptomyces sp. SID8379]|uniref:hypothetical protein n=1 Tax=unclassified Streptomyces TaxID=2593676 RepID=UPI00035EB333|nr:MULTISPECIES: hypothetical protein [unclassified Streptomyces]MYW70015.1 hypothetical protein [Streptomyces sp. SID8379]
MKRTSVLALAVLTLAAGAAPAAAAPDSRAMSGPGQVCFWTEPGQHGQAWCYAPPGYAEAENGTQRHAASFESRAGQTVYAISYTVSNCLYREIRPDDYDENWVWANKLDGVSDNTMGCERG